MHWGRGPGSTIVRHDVVSARQKNLLLAGLLVTAIAGHAALLLHWIHLDQAVGRPLVVTYVEPVTDLVRAHAQGRVGDLQLAQPHSVLAWIALGGRQLLGGHPDYLLWLGVIFLVGTQILLFDVGRLLEGPWAGLWVAALFPLYPEVALTVRRWAPQIYQLFFLVAAADLLLRSRGLSRLLPTVGFAVVALVGLRVSPMGNDNVCQLAAVGAMALGAGTRGVLWGRGPRRGQRNSRIVSLVFGLAAAAGIGLAVWQSGLVQGELSHKLAEMDNPIHDQGPPRWSVEALTAYARYFLSVSVGWILAVPFVAGLVLFVRRGQARAELLSWLFLPLVAFSLISKKNPYYLYSILPVFPLVTVLGLWKVRLVPARLLLLTVFLGWAIQDHRVDAFPWVRSDDRAPLFLRTFPGLAAWATWARRTRAFEAEVRPDLAPVWDFDHGPEWRFMAPHFAESTCPRTRRLYVHRPGDYSDLRLALSEKEPCLELSSWPETQAVKQAGWVLVKWNREAQREWKAAGSEEVPGSWQHVRRVIQSGQFHQLVEADPTGPVMELHRRDVGRLLPSFPDPHPSDGPPGGG